MPQTAPVPRGTPNIHGMLALAMLFFSLPLTGCGSAEPELPEPRPVVIRSGERIFAEAERMREVDEWFRTLQNVMNTDPGFWIIRVPRDTPSYPWESLVMSNDTARIGVQQGFDEAAQVFAIYAHYHLMHKLGRLEEFLPAVVGLGDYGRERAFLERVADAWLLGRAVYQAQAFEPLEEIMYASENGYLDALILTARGDEFSSERQAWLNEDPEALERYRGWFVETFNREPPGLRGTGS